MLRSTIERFIRGAHAHSKQLMLPCRTRGFAANSCVTILSLLSVTAEGLQMLQKLFENNKDLLSALKLEHMLALVANADGKVSSVYENLCANAKLINLLLKHNPQLLEQCRQEKNAGKVSESGHAFWSEAEQEAARLVNPGLRPSNI